MASFLRTASLVLSLSTVLLISGCCNGRPHPPDFTSYFTSPTSIRIEWQTPTLDKGATVKGFRLQYRLGESGKVAKEKTNAVYAYDIEGLDEACGDYRIRMSTASSSGLSRYTSYSQVERVNSAPQNLNAVPSDLSARITWDLPENGFCITGYELRYGPDNSQDESELRTMQLPIELNQYLLSDLEPGTSYMMSLTALAGEEMSEEAFFQWYQAPVAVRVPVPGSPTDLRVDPSLTGTADVTWSPPASSEITRYEYLYGTSETPDIKMTSGYVEVGTTRVFLEGLRQGEEYVIKVTSVNSVGQSSAAVVTWRQPAPEPVENRVPPQPIELRARPTHNRIVVSWLPPIDDSIMVQGYMLGYGANIPDLNIVRLPSSPTEFTITNLNPDTMYVLKLRAFNHVGEGTSVYKSARTLSATPPSKPLLPAPGEVTVRITSSESVLVTWTPPEGDVEFTGYIVGFGLQGTASRDLSLFSIPPDELEIELDELKPGSEYVVNIQAYDDVGDGEITSAEWLQETQEVPLSLPTEVRQVLTYSSSPATVMVSWVLSAEEAAEQTAGFRVTYGQTPAADEFSVDVDVGASSIELQNLKPDTFYYLKVYKFNAAGVSRPVSRSLQTLAPPPEEGCAQQQPCIQQFEASPQGDRDVCPRVLRYLNCLQSLQDVCMEDANYRSRVGTVRELFLSEGCNRNPRRNGQGGQDPPVPDEEECAGQRHCLLQYESQPNDGETCPRILQYLSCLQWLQDLCIVDAGYRRRIASVRKLFMAEGCHRNPMRTGTDGRDPPVPEIIPPPTNLQASVESPTSARISWTDETLGASQTINDDRYYNIRFHPRHEEMYLEQRAWETSFIADSLIPGVQYEFIVQLILGPRRRSEFSAPVFVTSRDPAQGTRVQRFTVTQVSVANAGNAKAVLNWLPPPDTQNVMEYRVEYTDAEKYRDPATIWQRVIVDGSKLSTIIDGLRPDTEYHIMITAIFSPTESGPALAAPVSFTTPVIPPSSKAGKRCGETELQAVTRRVNFLWDEVANGEQRPPLYGVPIPYCDDEFGVEECHGIFCFCIPGKRPAALRDAECTSDEPPCRREYNAARMALDEARQSGTPATAALLPHCRDDGYYHPKQCSGTMCYCVTENGAHTGRERPMWEASRLNCA